MSLENLDKAALIRLSEDNMREKLAYVPGKLSTMDTKTFEHTLVVDSGMPSDTFNAAFGGEITKELALRVIDYYQAKRFPMAWWIGPSSHNQLADSILSDCGLIHDELDIGMFCALDSLEINTDTPAGFEIKICQDTGEFNDFGKILSSIFDPIDHSVQQFYQMIASIPREEMNQLRLFVGYMDGQAVTTGAAFLTDVAGIYDISTHPEARKKGYGSAMFNNILKYVQDQGLRYAVLQASEDGLGIYKRSGFEEICQFNVWSNQELLSR